MTTTAKPKGRKLRNPWANYVPPTRNGPCVEEKLSGRRLPRPVPMYGPDSFTPAVTCKSIHDGPIEPGSALYCEVCSKWGYDYLLIRMPFLPPQDPATSYKPDDGLKGGKT